MLQKNNPIMQARDQQVSYLIHGRLREGGLINLIVSKSERPCQSHERVLVSVKMVEQLKLNILHFEMFVCLPYIYSVLTIE